MTHDDAVNECKAMGSQLLVAETEEEAVYLFEHKDNFTGGGVWFKMEYVLQEIYFGTDNL